MVRKSPPRAPPEPAASNPTNPPGREESLRVENSEERDTDLAGVGRAMSAFVVAVDKLEKLAAVQQVTLETLGGGFAGHDLVIVALKAEGALHASMLRQLFRAFVELSSAIAEGRDLPAPPDPEAARAESSEIDALRKMFRETDPRGEGADGSV